MAVFSRETKIQNYTKSMGKKKSLRYVVNSLAPFKLL